MNWTELQFWTRVLQWECSQRTNWLSTDRVSLSQSSRDADARDQWTRRDDRVTGSTCCRSVQFRSSAVNKPSAAGDHVHARLLCSAAATWNEDDDDKSVLGRATVDGRRPRLRSQSSWILRQSWTSSQRYAWLRPVPGKGLTPSLVTGSILLVWTCALVVCILQ